jgi:hypothetical protein
MSKFFSFDDFDQDQDISEDLDRLFTEPGDAIPFMPLPEDLDSNTNIHSTNDKSGSPAPQVPLKLGALSFLVSNTR